jgi:hypothetical protein
MTMTGPKGKKYPTLGNAARSIGDVTTVVGRNLKGLNWLKK